MVCAAMLIALTMSPFPSARLFAPVAMCVCGCVCPLVVFHPSISMVAGDPLCGRRRPPDHHQRVGQPPQAPTPAAALPWPRVLLPDLATEPDPLRGGRPAVADPVGVPRRPRRRRCFPPPPPAPVASSTVAKRSPRRGTRRCRASRAPPPAPTSRPPSAAPRREAPPPPPRRP